MEGTSKFKSLAQFLEDVYNFYVLITMNML